MKHLLTLILAAFALLGNTSCQYIIDKAKESDASTISGKQGDVLVVISKDYWESPLGQMIRDTLKKEYPMLPQIEPRFKLTNVPASGFTPMFQIQRNILRINIDPKNVNKVTFRKNVWATPQCVIDLKAEDYASAEELFRTNASKIVNVIEDAERERLINNNSTYPAARVEHEVQKIFGGSPVFPKDTKIYTQTDDFMWLATCDTDYIKQYIILYKYPVVKGQDMMSESNIIANNLKAVNTNTPGKREGSYMTHSKYIEPSVEYIKYNNKSLAEIRGLWEVENDYMGGPFISHVMCSPDGKYMIGIEGFVFAPKFDKIQYIRSVEAIVYSFKWTGSEK
jgi:hypothetical protein